MKYLKYSYMLDLPREEAFRRVLDIEDLQENAGVFIGGTVTANQLKPDEIGKKYVVSVMAGQETIETIIEVQQIENPERVKYGYTYRTVSVDGNIAGTRFLPWQSMTCIMVFQQQGTATLVTTTMFANGISSIWKVMAARILSVVNWFQQRKVIQRVKAFIESNS